MSEWCPLCHKCANRIVDEVEIGVHALIGCKAEPKIKDYTDAEKLCPIHPDRRQDEDR